MTRKDREQHSLEYYDIGPPKKDGKDEVARTITGHLCMKI
jgi:hypothetical protein